MEVTWGQDQDKGLGTSRRFDFPRGFFVIRTSRSLSSLGFAFSLAFSLAYYIERKKKRVARLTNPKSRCSKRVDLCRKITTKFMSNLARKEMTILP